MITIPEEAFNELLCELINHPIATNPERVTAGVGRTQTFGIVNRRMTTADYSRQCWLRPYLYKLLLDFASKYVTIPWNAITVNDCYIANPHRDRGNEGDSMLVAFGPYTDGALKVHEGPLAGLYNIRHTPLIMDFSKYLHSVEPFQGRRFSLVFYTVKARKGSNPGDLPPPRIVKEFDEWVFYRGEERVDKKSGLPHPLKGKVRSKKVQPKLRVKEIKNNVILTW
jgi:hypothetical protein